jgi:hypothetical protein
MLAATKSGHAFMNPNGFKMILLHRYRDTLNEKSPWSQNEKGGFWISDHGCLL